MAGVVVGAVLNKVLPTWLITCMLALTLSCVAWRTLITFKRRWDLEEANDMSISEQPVLDDTSTSDEVLHEKKDAGEGQPLLSSDGSTSTNTMYQPMLQRILADERRQIPWNKVLLICGVLALVLSCNVIKMNAFACNSAGFWVFTALPIPVALAAVYPIRKQLLEAQTQKMASGYTFVQGDMSWDERTTIVYPMICSLSGVFAGLFGIGGGIVKGPLMVEMGILSEISSATASFMILFTSASACTAFATSEQIKWGYGALLWAFGLVFTLVGCLVVRELTQRMRRPSLFVLLMGLVVALSTVLMVLEGVQQINKDDDDGKMGFRDICADL